MCVLYLHYAVPTYMLQSATPITIQEYYIVLLLLYNNCHLFKIVYFS